MSTIRHRTYASNPRVVTLAWLKKRWDRHTKHVAVKEGGCRYHVSGKPGGGRCAVGALLPWAVIKPFGGHYQPSPSALAYGANLPMADHHLRLLQRVHDGLARGAGRSSTELGYANWPGYVAWRNAKAMSNPRPHLLSMAEHLGYR